MGVEVSDDFYDTRNEESFNDYTKEIEEVLKKYNSENYKVSPELLKDILISIWQLGYENGYERGYENGYG